MIKWLERARVINDLVNLKLQEKTRLRALAEDISAAALTGMPYTYTGKVNQKVQDAALRLVMLEQEIDNVVDRYIDTRKEIEKVIEKLPCKEYLVLQCYYIQGLSWEKTAEEVGISTTHVWRLKNSAYSRLEKRIKSPNKQKYRENNQKI